MGKEIIIIRNVEVEKHKFHEHKSPISIGDVDINKIIVSAKVHFGKKKSFIYFIGCKENRKVRPLGIILLKMSFNEKYLKTKIKSYEGKTNTNFCGDKMPKGSQVI